MKKVILALAIVSVAFVACNNGESKEAKTDSPVVSTAVDTAAKAPVDTAAKAPVDTAAKAKTDTAAAKK